MSDVPFRVEQQVQPEPFKLVRIDDLGTVHLDPPPHLIERILPRGVPTLLGAHGGTGKSLFALTLAVCAAAGRDFMGLSVEPGPVVFYSAEDHEDVLRWRVQRICRYLALDPAHVAKNLTLLDATMGDPALYREVSEAGIRRGIATQTMQSLESWVIETEAVLLVVDNASDAYDAPENQRAQVRAFMRSLTQLARRVMCTCLLLAHIDKATAKGGNSSEGYSGSTAWHNSARSRLFLHEKDDVLTLEHQKANFGKRAEPLMLQWDNDMIAQASDATAAGAMTGNARAAAVLALILEYNQRDEAISPSVNARTNPYRMLHGSPEYPRHLERRDLEQLLREQQRAGRIEVDRYRTPDRKWRDRWIVTAKGKDFIAAYEEGAPSAPSAPSN